jgi:hypothetical protein
MNPSERITHYGDQNEDGSHSILSHDDMSTSSDRSSQDRQRCSSMMPVSGRVFDSVMCSFDHHSNPTSTMITLQTVPVDLLLNTGTYLNRPEDSLRNDINEITLAATLTDCEMMEHYMKRHTASDFISNVALSGNLKALRWVIGKGCPMDKWTSCYAAESGNMKMMKWLHRHGCPLTKETCNAAARSGNLKMLKWLHRHGCPLDENTCVAAAEKGNLDVLKWLRSQGCPWTWETFAAAVGSGNLEMLKWLHSAHCPWEKEVYWVDTSHEVADWLEEVRDYYSMVEHAESVGYHQYVDRCDPDYVEKMFAYLYLGIPIYVDPKNEDDGFDPENEDDDVDPENEDDDVDVYYEDDGVDPDNEGDGVDPENEDDDDVDPENEDDGVDPENEDDDVDPESEDEDDDVDPENEDDGVDPDNEGDGVDPENEDVDDVFPENEDDGVDQENENDKDYYEYVFVFILSIVFVMTIYL